MDGLKITVDVQGQILQLGQDIRNFSAGIRLTVESYMSRLRSTESQDAPGFGHFLKGRRGSMASTRPCTSMADRAPTCSWPAK